MSGALLQRVAGCLVVGLLLSGCAPKQVVHMDAPHAGSLSFLEDATGEDDYPSILAGEGNIYSCRYGIHFYVKDEFVPPKAAVFADLLAESKPAIATHKVRLTRMDVYRNWRLRLLSGAGKSMGGGVGYAIADSADKANNPTTTLDRFALTENPGDGRHGRTDNQIGCDGAGEGEYFASDVNGGRDVIVIWLEFDVDGRPYKFRSAYQFNYDSVPGNDKAVAEAIRETVTAAAAKVSL